MFKFYIKNCSLYFIKTTVTACILEYIFFGTSIICKATDCFCKRLIIGCYSASITKQIIASVLPIRFIRPLFRAAPALLFVSCRIPS